MSRSKSPTVERQLNMSCSCFPSRLDVNLSTSRGARQERKSIFMNLSHIWYEEICAGTKVMEFRAATDYWRKRVLAEPTSFFEAVLWLQACKQQYPSVFFTLAISCLILQEFALTHLTSIYTESFHEIGWKFNEVYIYIFLYVFSRIYRRYMTPMDSIVAQLS